MPDRPSRLGLLAGTLGAALAVVVLFGDCVAPVRAAPHDLGHAYGQLYVHEADFEGDADYPALYWAIEFRARALRRRPIRQIRAYATSLWQPQGDRDHWVAALPIEGRRPLAREWRTSIPWENRAELWWRVLELARGHVEDPPPNPCDGRVEHWGSATHPLDSHNAETMVRSGRWRELDCGDTLNRYFAVLRRRRAP